MRRQHRLNKIVTAVVESGSLEVATLATQFDVSAATIRRDLDSLEQQHLLSRTHGGATIHGQFYDIPLTHKIAEDSDEKRRIAIRAAEMVQAARVVGMTGGSTMTELARQFRGRSGFAVVTTAINIAAELAAGSDLRVFVAGGEVRRSSQEVIGRSAEAFVASPSIDLVFLGVDGVDLEGGCTTYDPASGRVNAALVTRASRVVVLADATKISRVAIAPVCPVSSVDTLITDARADRAALEAIRAAGCNVIAL